MTQAQVAQIGSVGAPGPRPRLDLDSLPGPAPMPIVGVYGNMFRFYFDQVRYLDELATGYGNVVCFARGMRRGILWPEEKSPGALFLFGDALLQQVLIKHATSSFAEVVVAALPPEWGPVARLTGGLLWTVGDQHRQHRRLIVPLYHQKRVQHHRDLIVGIVGRTLDRYKPNDTMDITEMTGRMLVEFQNEVVLGATALGGRLAQLGERMVEFSNAVGSPVVHFTPDWPFSPRRHVLNLGRDLSQDLDELIAIKRAKPGSTDVLAMLVEGRCEDGSPLSDDELVSETLNLFVGGWISTRSSMGWTALLLAQHPQVAAELYEELDSVLHGEAPTIEQLKQLPLLDRVMKESHRLIPPIPVLSRVATEDVVLGGHRVPARTELYLSIYHTHRNPTLFPEPQRFLPDRWLNLNPGPYEYLPFGIGARTCPGLALATLQMKISLAMLLQRYRLELPRDSKIDCAGVGVISPKPDVRMILRKQDKRFSESRQTVRGNVNQMVDFDA
jgi:cytochrome P450